MNAEGAMAGRRLKAVAPFVGLAHPPSPRLAALGSRRFSTRGSPGASLFPACLPAPGGLPALREFTEKRLRSSEESYPGEYTAKDTAVPP